MSLSGGGLGNGHIFWEVGKPINGMSRVGPVYPPPEERGHGYGSAVTAVVSR